MFKLYTLANRQIGVEYQRGTADAAGDDGCCDDFGKLFPGALLLKNRYDKQKSTTTNRPVSDKKAAARAAQEASEARLAALREAERLAAEPRPRKVLADAVAELVTVQTDLARFAAGLASAEEKGVVLRKGNVNDRGGSSSMTTRRPKRAVPSI